MTEDKETTKAKILIVEDEALIALDLKTRLKNWGYTVLGHEFSAEKALELIEQDRPDLVLMDIVLQGPMAGIEAADILRTRWGIPVILTTAYTDRERIKRAKLTYPFGYLVKPYHDRDIEITIEMALYVSKLDGERRKVEEELWESEKRFRTLVEQAPEAIVVYDVNENQFVDTNINAERLFGCNREELLKSGPERFYSANQPNRRPIVESMQENIARTLAGENLVFERAIRTNDGRELVCEVRLARLPAVDRQLIRASYIDITERKQAEEKLQESEQRQRMLFEQMSSGVVVYEAVDGGEDFIIKDFNQAAEKIEKVSREEVIGKRITKAFPGVREFGVFEVFQRVWRTGEQEYFLPGLYRDERDPGTWRENWVYKLPTGEIVALYNDISERKQAEDARSRLVAMLEATPDFAGYANAETAQILYVNKGGRKMCGLTEDEDVTKLKISDMHPAWTNQMMRDTILPTATCKGFWSGECAFVHRDGREIPVRMVLQSHKSNTGEVKFFSTMSTDITERLRAEAQIRQLQKAESLGRMAGAIAHHFNNLLGAVLGNLEFVMIDLPGDAGPLANLTEAMKAARRAAEVSGLMLTYLGQTVGPREPLDLSAVCRQSLPQLRAALPQNMDLEADFPSPGPTIQANAHQVQQVLTHLTTNAWEAFEEGGGVIHLTVKTVSPADIPATHRFPLDWQPLDQRYACLEVTDTGCGIAEKDIEQLFDPFFSTKFTGRGLGLPVVLGIVRAHGGAVGVESRIGGRSAEGGGSVLRVYLPLTDEEIPRSQARGPETTVTVEGGTVLLVEDEPALRQMAATMLTRLGFTTLEAKDGLEAVEVFRQHQDAIRCVLCDLTMPRLGGWKTLAALRQLAPGLPVILSSGYDQTQVLAGDHPEWPQAFLGKPYSLTELRDALRQALESKRT